MRSPCCDKSKVKKGPWSPVEDSTLTNFIQKNGHDNWRSLPKQAGLLRCGKSCRLRWINYLRPDVKRGNFTPEEEDTIIKLHSSMGNKWSKIASLVPGRTDNEIKNVWNTHLKKKSMQMSSSGSKNCLLKSDSSRPIGEYSSVVSSESSVLNRDQDMHGKGEEEGPQIDAEMSCNQKDNLSRDKEPIKETSTSFSSSSSKMESGHEEGTGSLLNSVDSGEVYNPMHQLADDHAIETQTTDDVFLEIPMMADPTDMDIWSMLESNEDLTLPPLELTDQEGMPQNSDNGYSNIGYGHEDLVLEIEEAEYMKWLQMFRK